MSPAAETDSAAIYVVLRILNAQAPQLIISAGN